MTDFDRQIEQEQLQWRGANISCKEYGLQNKKLRPWILPKEMWEENLWPGIRSGSDNSLPDYLDKNGIDKHTGVHNLKSSWVLCANLYFPFRHDKAMLAGFLKTHVGDSIDSVEEVELEYAEAPPFDPITLFNEPGSITRGTNQTSPDIAFIVTTNSGGKGLILTENKYTEHSFYKCSGRDKKYGNPDAKRCLDLNLMLNDISSHCYQLNWETHRRKNRKYWDHFSISNRGKLMLRQCPAATAGYQLFRQQALAEAIAESDRYEFVVSCVAYDKNNMRLIKCLSRTGIRDFTKSWADIFEGKTKFTTFTHQQWVQWVRNHDDEGRWGDWLEYIENRYGY